MTETVRQLALELPHRPALQREDFLVAPANELAVAWIDRWPRWPQPAMLLHGPAGSGKSHLCSVWRRASGAVDLPGEALKSQEPPSLLGAHRAAVIDGFDTLVADCREDAPALERRVLHLYNLLREREGHLLLTGRNPPAGWRIALPDLRSRLGAAPAVELGRPDDRLIEAVLVKLFADRQLRVAPDVIRFLLPRIERSFAALRDLVAELDRASLAARREITIPLARAVLGLDKESPGNEGNDSEGNDSEGNDSGENDHGHGNRG